MDTEPIILFDGICNLCNAAVQYIINHDPKASFKFATLQGKKGQQLLNNFGHSNKDLNSFVLIRDNKVYTRSSAALNVAKHLKGISKLLYVFIIVPPFIRNAIYDLIAGKRYKWFGKKDICMIPTETIKTRFLN